MNGILIRVSIAPLLSQPALQSEQVSQLPLGEGAEVLESRGPMLRVRTLFDNDEGWLHRGYTVATPLDDVVRWRDRAEWSLGATLRGAGGMRLAVPHRARLIRRDANTVALPQGQEAVVFEGTIIGHAEMCASSGAVPAAEWAWREFTGAPYLWGGISRGGIDCSALVQNTFAARGTTLPRDSSEQARTGTAVDATDARAGDLLFFRSAEGTAIGHVAIYAGEGMIVHSAVDTGGVTRETWSEGSRAAPLRERLVSVRRMH